MGSDCPDCKGTGYVQPKFTSNDGNVSTGQIVKVPCPNPNCATRKRQDILGAKEFFALQRKDIVIVKVKATISAVPPMRKKEELGTTITLTNVNAKDLTDHIFEAAHQSLRSEYRDMYIASIECDGNLYNFKGAERPTSGHLATEIKPQEKPAMPTNNLPTDESVDVVIKPVKTQLTVAEFMALSADERPPVTSNGEHITEIQEKAPFPNGDKAYRLTGFNGDIGRVTGDHLLTILANQPAPAAALSKADASARWIIAELDKYSVWGDWLTVSDWLKAHEMTLETYNDDIQNAITEDFKAELRVELERGGLKAVQATIFGLFGVNKIEDALHKFSPDDIRKKIAHRVNEEIKLKQQQEIEAEGQRRIDANQRAPLTNVIPPDNTTQSVAIPRPNPNAAVFGTGDPSFDLMVAKATIMLKSGLLPYTIKTVEQVITIGMMGQVLGLEMITAVNMIDVIGGRPAIKPQLMIALCRQKGLMEKMDIADDGTACSVTMQRKGEAPYTATFSMEDAKRLTTSEGSGNERRVIPLADKKNWKEQPKVMRQWRAISAAMRVVFPDVILGMYTPDELESGEDGQSVDPKVTVEKTAA
jgi:RecT family protein